MPEEKNDITFFNQNAIKFKEQNQYKKCIIRGHIATLFLPFTAGFEMVRGILQNSFRHSIFLCDRPSIHSCHPQLPHTKTTSCQQRKSRIHQLVGYKRRKMTQYTLIINKEKKKITRAYQQNAFAFDGKKRWRRVVSHFGHKYRYTNNTRVNNYVITIKKSTRMFHKHQSRFHYLVQRHGAAIAYIGRQQTTINEKNNEY